jgi:two-component system, NarL family, nitrate/nitrite response regulator NarL
MTTEATNDSTRKNVLICDTQPVAVEGMKWLIENTGDLRFAGSVPTLEAVYNLLYPEAAPVMVEQESSEIELAELAQTAPITGIVEITTGDEVLASPETLHLVPSVEEVSTLPALEASGPTLEAVAELPAPEQLDAIVIDKGLGFAGVMDLLQRLTANSHPTPVVVWGASVSEAEALRLLQAGARGILRRTSESGTLLTCLRAVTTGGTWMEDGIFGSTEKLFNPKRSQLTNRESQVVVLVEKGLRNRDIARQLGIQTGTVKIHLKHIFEKTGVRGRYGLAFTGLQNKGSISPSAPAQFTA